MNAIKKTPPRPTPPVTFPKKNSPTPAQTATTTILNSNLTDAAKHPYAVCVKTGSLGNSKQMQKDIQVCIDRQDAAPNAYKKQRQVEIAKNYKQYKIDLAKREEAYRIAQANLKTAQANLKKAQRNSNSANSEVLKLQSQLEQAKAKANSANTDLKAAQAKVNSAEAVLNPPKSQPQQKNWFGL
ncbi:MAG: hypothetical protein ACK5T0_03420 [Vampirovibrionales bacterium]